MSWSFFTLHFFIWTVSKLLPAIYYQLTNIWVNSKYPPTSPKHRSKTTPQQEAKVDGEAEHFKCKARGAMAVLDGVGFDAYSGGRGGERYLPMVGEAFSNFSAVSSTSVPDRRA